MWVEVDAPQEFGFPRGRHRGSYARGFVRWEGSDTTTLKADEDALDGIAAAENNGGDVGHRAPLRGKQEHLRTESQRCIGRYLVEVPQCADLGLGQRW
jgi:hypothetical protein